MRHIVGLSGGKDSTAMALRLRELHPDVEFEYICTPTGNELDEMHAHWSFLESILSSPLVRLSGSGSVGQTESLETLIDHFTALPNNRMRWCTRILKIEPTLDFLEKIGRCKFYVGLRADEEQRVGGVYDEIEGAEQIFPMRDWGWSVGDVWDYLNNQGITIPPRSDCALCYHQRLGEWYNLWSDHPQQYAKGIEIEMRVSKSRGKPCTFRNDSRDTWPASLVGLAERFEQGDIPQGADPTLDLFGGGGICRTCTL